MNFVMLDDVGLHNETLSTKVMQLCEKNSWDAHIALKTTDYDAVMDYAAGSRESTVYFLDIELGNNKTTLPLHTAIQQSPCENYIIYVSAYAQYALDCLHTHAFDFLLKPLSETQLEDCLAAVMKASSKKESAALLQVNTGNRTMLVNPENILYFSRDRMIIRLHAQDGSTLVWRESFDHLLTRLDSSFSLCHRSFVVNLRKVKHIDWEKNELCLSDETILPISRRRITALKAALKQLEVQG